MTTIVCASRETIDDGNLRWARHCLEGSFHTSPMDAYFSAANIHAVARAVDVCEFTRLLDGIDALVSSFGG
jgi:hypothetical protein